MTPGQRGEAWLTPNRLPLRFLAALLILSISGCAPFQKTWSHRFGGDRLASGPVPESIRSVPVDDELSRDPYADRLALSDSVPDPGWAPVSDRARNPLPQAGSVPIAPPSTRSPGNDPQEVLVTPIEPAPPGGEPPPTIATTPSSDSGVDSQVIDDIDAIDRLMDRGIASLGSFRNYRTTLDRQERVRDTLLPAEQVILSVRTDPFAVRLEWPDGANKGREVLYSVPGTECEGMMHVKLGKTLIPVPPMQLEPNSPIALSNGRHPITEAGLLHILTETKAQVERSRAGDPKIGQFELLGPLVLDEAETPCFEILRKAPDGEFWRLVVEEETILPVLLEATDGSGQLLERYHFQNIETNLTDLDDVNAFNPSVRFGRPITLPSDRIATGRPDQAP